MPLFKIIERDVKDAVKKCLNELGAYHHWPVQHGYGAPCLDCHGCYKGLYFSVETKRPGKKPTPLQEQTIEKISAAGGLVFVIDDPEDTSVITHYLKAYASDPDPLHCTYKGIVVRPPFTKAQRLDVRGAAPHPPDPGAAAGRRD